MGYAEEELTVPWEERIQTTVEVEEDETLGDVLALAAQEFGLVSAWDGPLAESFAWVGLYLPDHDHGVPVRQLSAVTLADKQGRAVWNVYFKEVTYAQLLWSAEAGALEGDPLRIYLFTWAGFGNGMVADFTILANLWDLAWYVMERVGVAYGSFEALRQITQRIRRGREVASAHKTEWRDRGGDPATLSQYLRHRPSTTSEVARFLDCSDEETEALLWAFGFAPEAETGLWKLEENDEAKMLQGTWELIVYGYGDIELEQKFRERAEMFAQTGTAPEIDWGYGEWHEDERAEEEGEPNP